VRSRDESSGGRRALLALDGAINLLLGAGLIVFPRRLVLALGIPAVESAFYPSILGGVLFGIGVALLLERLRRRGGRRGLGLAGAVAINLCGGLVLAGWLALGGLELPFRGRLFLWGLVVVLVGLSAVELAHRRRPVRTADER
jgi:hypothetical protein